MHQVDLSELPNFTQNLQKSRLSIAEQAVAILWFFSYCEATKAKGIMPSALARLMDQHELCNFDEALSHVNGLGNNSDHVKLDARKGGLVVNYRNRRQLDERFASLLSKPPDPHISKPFVEPIAINDTTSLNRLFPELVRQANFCYEFHLFDACALVCRRLTEILLIRSFNANAALHIIQDNSGVVAGLGSIIGKAKSGSCFNLSQPTKNFLDAIHALGNNAAHSQFYALKQLDLDQIRLGINAALPELLDVARIPHP